MRVDVDWMRMPVSWPSFVTGESLDFWRDAGDWPNRHASRFVRAAGLRWHVQELGRGPALLLVHGTGASTHSWRGLAPLLAEHFTVVAADLPGHGFTETPSPSGLSLPGMARGLGALLGVLGQRPVLALGPSAGAAIACRMCLDGLIHPRRVVSVNGSLRPFRGFARRIYSPFAKLLTWNPILPRIVARRAADPAVVESLLRDSGSRLDPAGEALYRRLARNPRHVAGALGMMASWDLEPLDRDLPALETPLVLVVGEQDRFVPPRDADYVRRRVPGAVVRTLAGLGHLAHEERPSEIAEIVMGAMASRAELASPDGEHLDECRTNRHR